MSIGYACLALGVPHTDYRTCKIESITNAVLMDLIAYNLESLERIIDYNIQNGIHLFRISSDVFLSDQARKISWNGGTSFRMCSNALVIKSKFIKYEFRCTLDNIPF